MVEQLKSLVAAMEILPDGLLIIDHRHRIVGCNGAAERIFGYEHGELLEKPMDILIPPSYRDAHKKKVSAFSPTDGARPMEGGPILSGISKDGKRLPLSIGISTIEAENECYYVAVVRDASSLDDTLNEAVNLAHIDPLTQLGNRRYLSSQFDGFSKDATGTLLALLYLDLDRFKPLNDEYGHEMGDEVLTIVARRLRAGLRSCDTCVRVGGDEFVVLVANVKEPESLEQVARKLHDSIVAPIHALGETVRVGVSIGGAIGKPGCSGPDSLLDQADAAMYRAKTAGVAYCFHKPESAAAA